MHITLRLFIIATIIVQFSCHSTQKYNQHIQTPLSVEQMKKDIRFVERKLFNMHPNVDWYISKEALHQQFDSLRKNITQPMLPNNFFIALSPIIASVRQAHMSMHPIYPKYNTKNKSYKNIYDMLAAFEFTYLDNKLYIQSHQHNDSFPQAGTEVIAINHIKPQDIYTKHQKSFTSDGYNTTFQPYLFAFRVKSLYAATLGLVDSLQMTLSINDSLFTYNVPNAPRDTKSPEEAHQKKSKEEKRREKIAQKQKKLYGYDYKTKSYAKILTFPIAQDSSIAILKINNFLKGKQAVYDTIFTHLKKNKVEHLILDLRNNLGGSIQEANYLARFLTKDSSFIFSQNPIVSSKFQSTYIFKSFPAWFNIILLPFSIPTVAIRTLKTYKNKDNQWEVSIQQSKPSTAKANAYNKQLYVLINGSTFSASSFICTHLDNHYQGAIFVGEEAGGAYNGTVAGQIPKLTLPHSKLTWRVGTMVLKPNHQQCQEGRGMIPHQPIYPTASDLQAQKDAHLEWVLKDIYEKKKIVLKN